MILILWLPRKNLCIVNGHSCLQEGGCDGYLCVKKRKGGFASFKRCRMNPQEREIDHVYPRRRARGSIYVMEKREIARHKQNLYVARTLSGWQHQILRKSNGKLSSFHV